MVITCDDLLFNDFHMSDYDIVCGNGSDGMIDDTESIGMTPSVTKVFNGENPHSTYISQKYEDNPVFTIKFTKASCDKDTNDYFGENELRQFNRLLTGKPGYSWLKLVNTSVMETDFYYRARVSSVEYERLGTHVVGYDVTFELDGGMAYSEEQTIYISAKANVPFFVYCNTDDLHGYTLPKVKITVSTAGTLTLTNKTESWKTEMANMTAGEVLTIDSKNELLSSSKTRRYILNDYNLHWIRFLPGRNEYICNRNATIEFTFRAARKVGYVS